MSKKLVCGAVLLLSFAATFIEAHAGATTPEKALPSPEASAPSDPSAVSSGFWSDWNRTKSSANFAALTTAVGCGCGPLADGAQNQGKATIDIAITGPAEAAQFMSESVVSSQDPVSDAALATVVNMRISPDVQQAAAPLVAPEAKARVEEFRANLSTGIPGLPGIYLGDHADGGGRPGLPEGYTPVAGGSMGCPSRY
jgi:hypothetical protein